MDGPMDGRFFYTIAIDTSENHFQTYFAIFTKAAGTNGPKNQCTDGLLDQQTQQRTHPCKEMQKTGPKKGDIFDANSWLQATP